MFAKQIKCIDYSSLSLLNSFVFLHCFFFLLPMALLLIEQIGLIEPSFVCLLS